MKTKTQQKEIEKQLKLVSSLYEKIDSLKKEVKTLKSENNILKKKKPANSKSESNIDSDGRTKTKFEWRYRYVTDGQLEPDEYGRWAIDCYMFVHIENSLPNYKWYKKMFGKDYLPVRVATMCQKGCTPNNVPSLIHKFCVTMPTFEDAGNNGLSTQSNFFSNDIEELKAIVEKEFEDIRTVFSNCL